MAYLIKRDVCRQKKSCSYIIYPIEDQVCSTYTTNTHHFFIKKIVKFAFFHRLLLTLEDSL